MPGLGCPAPVRAGGRDGEEPVTGAGCGTPGPSAWPGWEQWGSTAPLPAAMAAHGKLRRERGLQTEYETQIKGERVLGSSGPIPCGDPKAVEEPQKSRYWPRARCPPPGT